MGQERRWITAFAGKTVKPQPFITMLQNYLG